MASTEQKDWMASGSDLMRRAMQNRRLEPDVPHLKPLLDGLPAGSVVLEVGCGPGGITLDIAQRYPALKVLGMDIDEESIQVRYTTLLYNFHWESTDQDIACQRSSGEGWHQERALLVRRCVQPGQAGHGGGLRCGGRWMRPRV